MPAVCKISWKTNLRLDLERSWRKIGFEQTDEHPVSGVSWNDATGGCLRGQALCSVFSVKTKGRFSRVGDEPS